jgi:ketosteroid isomerase-like protein
MSQENAEVARRTFEAIARRDIDALLELYDAEIEYLPLTGTRVESGGWRARHICGAGEVAYLS